MARKTFLIVATAICGLFCCVPSADATLVIVEITAEVTLGGGGPGTGILENRINVGDTITGVYIYDLSTPDSDRWRESGLYEHDAPPYGITLMVGGLVFMTDPENVEFSIDVRNDSPLVTGTIDAFRIESTNNLPLPNGFPVGSISINFYDESCSALSSTALPTTAPVIEDWETGVITIQGWRARQYMFTIEGVLTSATLIPEPATIWLLVLGGFALLRRCKR